MAEHIYPQERECFWDYMEELKRHESEAVYRYMHPVKGVIYIRCTGRRVPSPDNMIRLVGYHQEAGDIVHFEKEKLLENRLLQQNQHLKDENKNQISYYKELLDTISVGVLSYTLPEHEIVHMNAEAMRIYGVETVEEAQEDAAKLIEHLGLQDEEDPVATLKTMNYADLRTACDEIGIRSWGTVNDGEYFQGTVVDGKYNENAKDIPLVLSTVFSEMGSQLQQMMFVRSDLNSVEQMYPGEPMDELTAQYGDKAEAIAEEFEKAYPCRDLTDVLTINANRTNDLAIEKAQDGGQIWQAVFAYKLPVFGGSNAWHTGGDVPFIFHNADKIPYLIAGDEENAYALLAYAKTGDPSTEALQWPQFTVENGETMIFDNESAVENYHDVKLLELVKEATAGNEGDNPFASFGGGEIGE